MASIQADKGYLRIKYYVNGKAQYEYTGLKDTPENRAKLAFRVQELEFNLSKPKSALKQHLLLDDAFLLFYKSKPKISTRYKEMFELIRDHLNHAFPKDKTVQLFTAQDVDYFEKFLLKRDSIKSNNTIATYFIHLGVLFNFLKKKGFIDENIISKIEGDEVEIELIPDIHRQLILNHLKDWNIEQYTFFSFLDDAGKRQSDGIALRWEDIDWNENLIWMRNVKGKRRSYVYMFPAFRKRMYNFWVLKGKPASGKVFVYKGRSSLHWWKRALKRLKLPSYKMHSIRKTFTSDLLDDGTSIYDTMKLTDHKDIRTINKHYAKLDAVRLGKRAARIRTRKKIISCIIISKSFYPFSTF